MTDVIYHESKTGKFNPKSNSIFPKWCPKNKQEIREFKLLLHKKLDD